MSRWWGREVRIAVCPDRLVVVRLQNRLGTKIVAKALVPAEPASEGPIWQSSVRALRDYLKVHPPGSVPISVVLSNRFARYALVPWHPDLLACTERLAFARHYFKDRYGEVAAKWLVQLSDGAYGEANVACAVDEGLIKGVRQVAREANARLASVQPYLVAAFNQFRREIASKRGTTCFATFEPGALCLSWFHGARWKGVKTRRVTGEWEHELRSMLMEEIGGPSLDALPSVVHVFAPERDRPIAHDSGFRLNRLTLPARPGFSPATDARYAMGLCGIT